MCKSKAKWAYDKTNELLGIVGREPWVHAQKAYPFEPDYKNYPHGKTPADEEMRLRYEEFQEYWEAVLLDVLNLRLGSIEPLLID